MERVPGIEPGYPAWKAGVLPLNYTRILVGVTGIEPATSWSQTTRAPICATPRRVFLRRSLATTIVILQYSVYYVNTFFKVFFKNFIESFLIHIYSRFQLKKIANIEIIFLYISFIFNIILFI